VTDAVLQKCSKFQKVDTSGLLVQDACHHNALSVC